MNHNGNFKFLKPVFHVTRDMAHLKRWQIQIFEWVFIPLLRLGFRLGLPVLVDKKGARLEVLSVAETDAIASAIVASVGGESFYVPNVPMNMTLPKSNVIFGGNRAPYSQVASLYEENGKREDVAVLCPIFKTRCAQHESIDLKTVESLYHRIKTVAAS